MVVIESILGNRNDAAWADRLTKAHVDVVTMDQWEAQKSRFRKLSRDGVQIAVSLDRGIALKDGDILVWDPENQSAVVANILLKDVLVIDLSALADAEPELLIRTAVELGHAIGNQHWPAVVKGNQVFVPLSVDKKVMASVMKTHAFQGITYEFLPGSEIIPYLAPHESRRLFGGAEGPVHTHTQMNMKTKATMPITELMQVLQLGDSTLPVGAFSFSNGLESAVQLGLVTDVGSLREFVFTVTQLTAGVDGIALLEAHRATLDNNLPRVLRADDALHQRKLNEELRLMTVRMGKKLAEMGGRVFEAPMLADWLSEIKNGKTPGTYSVGQGILFADLGLSETDAFAVHQYGVASTILGAALRLVRVDHLDTQSILSQVNAQVAADYDRVSKLPLEDMAAFTPALDILSSVHVKAHVRMFMN